MPNGIQEKDGTECWLLHSGHTHKETHCINKQEEKFAVGKDFYGSPFCHAEEPVEEVSYLGSSGPISSTKLRSQGEERKYTQFALRCDRPQTL